MSEIIEYFLQFIISNLLNIAVYGLAAVIIITGALTIGNKVVLWIIEWGLKYFQVWPELVRWVRHREEFKEWLDDKPARDAWLERKIKQEDSQFYKSGVNAEKRSNEGLNMNKFVIFKVGYDDNGNPLYNELESYKEYFILRLDGMNDPKDDRYFWACRKAANVLANEIEPQYPQLAEDIRKKWPYEE